MTGNQWEVVETFWPLGSCHLPQLPHSVAPLPSDQWLPKRVCTVESPGEIQKLLIFASHPHFRLRLGFNWSGRSFSFWKLWGLFQWFWCADQSGNHHLHPLPQIPPFSTHPSVFAAPTPWINICPWDSTNQSPCCFVLVFHVFWDSMTMFQWNGVSSLFLFSTSILMPNP